MPLFSQSTHTANPDDDDDNHNSYIYLPRDRSFACPSRIVRKRCAQMRFVGCKRYHRHDRCRIVPPVSTYYNTLMGGQPLMTRTSGCKTPEKKEGAMMLVLLQCCHSIIYSRFFLRELNYGIKKMFRVIIAEKQAHFCYINERIPSLILTVLFTITFI